MTAQQEIDTLIVKKRQEAKKMKQQQGLTLALAGGALLYGATKVPAIYTKPMKIGGGIMFGFGIVLLALTLSSDVTGGSANLNY
tara:strand:- start:3929 stop:4180 length:252 start_codon:yes stop_codon:yes gene_type:complete